MKPVFISILLAFLICGVCRAQGAKSLCRASETQLFGFTTTSGRVMSICTAADTSYIVYRYGRPGHVELEYPRQLRGSWSAFTYSYYLRGGGAANAGLDLNELSFENAGYAYTVYEEYSAEDDTTRYGIRITDPQGNPAEDIHGLPESVIGSLIPLRDNEKINTSS